MSTPLRAWLIGASCGSIFVALVNDRLILSNQKDMLLSLRCALMSYEVRNEHKRSQIDQHERFPFFSRETLNLALVAISDRFIFDKYAVKSE
jgi:hypothetical protein